MPPPSRTKELPRLITKASELMPGQNYLDILLQQKLKLLSEANTEFLKRSDLERAELKYELKLLEKEKVKFKTDNKTEKNVPSLPQIVQKSADKKDTSSRKPSIYHMYTKYQMLNHQSGVKKLESIHDSNASKLKLLNKFHSNCNLWWDRYPSSPPPRSATTINKLNEDFYEPHLTELAILKTPFIRRKKIKYSRSKLKNSVRKTTVVVKMPS